MYKHKNLHYFQWPLGTMQKVFWGSSRTAGFTSRFAFQFGETKVSFFVTVQKHKKHDRFQSPGGQQKARRKDVRRASSF